MLLREGVMSDFARLKEETGNYTILYAEDNDALREQAGALLKKLFSKVYLARDGEEALQLFRKHRPLFVLSDIKMPKMDGLALTSLIHKSAPETKLIIMSAFDDKEYLFQAINAGIFRYLKKPVSIAALSGVLEDALLAIHEEEKQQLFFTHLKDIFNYQSAMVVMLQGEQIMLVSQRFLDFFGVNDKEEFLEKRDDLGACMLKHEGFLYNTPARTWLAEASKHPDALYHVKMTDHKHEMHHFIFKLHFIPEKEGYSIVSFDDITELNLLGLFDQKRKKEDDALHNQKAIMDLLEVVMRNHAKVKLYNFYRGLGITNDGLVIDAKETRLRIRSNYLQQKVIQIERHTILTSEALPYPVMCESLKNINVESQDIDFALVRFMPKSPIDRKSIRVEPDENHTITLFMNEHKFFGEIQIVDVSLEAVKVSMNALPAGMEIETVVRLDMIFTLDKKQIIINTEASLYKKSESNRMFYLVFLLHLPPAMKRPLTEYISKRQMQLIREFKGLQNG